MLTTTIVLIILYFIYRWSVAWVNYYNQLDKRFGLSIWRYSYDYQVVGKEKISINNKEYLTEHFKLRSKNESLSDDKKLNFDIWYNPENNLIIKVSYSKIGNWEYRLKNFE